MITFIDYHYNGIGGVGQIVVNTTLELNRRNERTKLYCSSESYEYKRLIECKADFEFVDSDIVSFSQLKDYLTEDDQLVLTTVDDTPLLEKIKKLNNKLIFYSVHPDTFFWYGHHMDWICSQKAAAIKLIQSLYENNALYLMDGPNLLSIKRRGWSVDNYNDFLPVPVKSYIEITRDCNPSDIFNITYLGRGNEDWKIFPVIKILKDLNKYSMNIKMTVITDTNSMFVEMINHYIPNNRINVEYINNLYGSSLDDYLYHNSSLHISMGTSALEGAKLGIPTILIDYSKEEFPDNYLYRWLYESKDYSLAGEIRDSVLPYNYGNTLSEMIKSISDSQSYKMVSDNCREYVENNHLISVFVDRLEDAFKKTTMTSKMYCNTRFSKNMYYIKPIVNFASKIKHFGKES